MLRLRPGQRQVLVDHVPELANFAAGSLLFGQFLTERDYSFALATVGIVAWAVLTGIALYCAAGNRQ